MKQHNLTTDKDGNLVKGADISPNVANAQVTISIGELVEIVKAAAPPAPVSQPSGMYIHMMMTLFR
jgi:hypothetical protein